ncbi:membrane progestin receptor alpha [Solea senegalensis]|uniref:Membrane progestin receptor alpha n=1 Tax=Solea senegalensis TaxID=28829 RepID=A0AAV6PMM4_SOLSE|nr:membrane progestin receptor alpha [Solea senegalensis]
MSHGSALALPYVPAVEEFLPRWAWLIGQGDSCHWLCGCVRRRDSAASCFVIGQKSCSSRRSVSSQRLRCSGLIRTSTGCHGHGGDGTDWSPVHQCAAAASDPSAAGVGLPYIALHCEGVRCPLGVPRAPHPHRLQTAGPKLALLLPHPLSKWQEISETVDFLRDPHAQPLFIVLLAAFTYLSFSALAHLLSAKSELSCYTFYFLDYVGVAVYQYGSALAHYYYAIEKEWHTRVQGLFLPAAAFLAWLTCFGCCYGKYASHDIPKFVLKLFQVVPSALAYCLDISPVVHRIYKCYQEGCSDPTVVYHFYHVVFFLVSAYFFCCPHPESLFPGKCDFIGQGHQIFHVFVVVCTLTQIEALRTDFTERRSLYERLHGDLAHDAVALFIFTACCSALTAFYVRRRVHDVLDEKED